MSASIVVATDRGAATHLGADELAALRASLTEALRERQDQCAESESLYQTVLHTADDHDREVARIAAERARDSMYEIDAAIRRFEDGEYGTCEACGRPIPFERLEAIPHARRCVACPQSTGAAR